MILLTSVVHHPPAQAQCLPTEVYQRHIYSHAETPRGSFAGTQGPPSCLQCSFGKNGCRGRARHATAQLMLQKCAECILVVKRCAGVPFLPWTYLPELLPQTEQRCPASRLHSPGPLQAHLQITHWGHQGSHVQRETNRLIISRSQ